MGGRNRAPQIVVVCGVKNSGKTTLLEQLVRIFSRKGRKVAVIKHDGHDFFCDVPGTDSYRFTQAGAYGTAVFSDHRMFVHKIGCMEREQELIRQFPEADLILIEGLKESSYPKIEVIRKEISNAPVSNPVGRFLIVTDHAQGQFPEATLGFDQIEEIAETIMQRRMTGDDEDKRGSAEYRSV